MNRRQVMTTLGTGGFAFTASAAAADPAPVLKISVAIPDLYDLEGKLSIPRTLRNAGYGFRFFVVVENVSAADLFIWSEGNSEGHGTVSFEVIDADGAKTVIRRIAQDWSKNVLRTEKLVPGALHVRAVEYDTLPGNAAQWEAFPFGAKNARRDVTLRAVFEQPKLARESKLAFWSGKVISPAYKVLLLNE